MESSSTRPRRSPYARMVQNFLLVWLDRSIDEPNNKDCSNSITQLQQVVNTVTTFTDVNECIDFITDMEEENTFLIVSEPLSQIIVPIVQDIHQVSSIYIFCEHKVRHEQWEKERPKVKGVFTDIMSICEALKQAAQDCDHNSASISFVKLSDEASSEDSDQLDQSFMYTQILKEILLTIDFEQEQINEFLTYCREQFADNSVELNHVEKIEKEYFDHQPIWWYTHQCFLYSMLNRALRAIEVDLIIKMGFFIRDLHKHIANLHSEQYAEHHHSNSFTLYRGQGLSQTDFAQLKSTQGGLLSFNNFLSTSKTYQVSLTFARRTIATSDLIGVLFVMKINPSMSATPFADVRDVSAYKKEEEILFSMHSIFRIGQISQIDENNRLWQVELTLTNKNDPHLHALTEHMRKEILPLKNGWYRLGELLCKLGQFDRAQQVYEILLDRTYNNESKMIIYHRLGFMKHNLGRYEEAIQFYEKSLETYPKTLQKPLVLASIYNNIAMVYEKTDEYSKATSSHEKALEIYQKALPPNHPALASSYNNIGMVYEKLGEYLKALSYYEKALKIREKTLPPYHPALASSYNNIGMVYEKIGEYSKALSYSKKDLEICQKTLPPNHPELIITYNNISMIYGMLREYSKAIEYQQQVLEIQEKTLSANHPNFAISYNNIGTVYVGMGEYSKALSHYEKSLEIRQKTLSGNHPDLGTVYTNIGSVYTNMGEYSKALSYYERALKIFQSSLPSNHPSIETVKESIKIIKKKL